MADDSVAPQEPSSDVPFEYRLQRTLVGVVLIDADLTIRAINPVARRLLAPAGIALDGVSITELHAGEAREKLEFLISRARASADGVASLVVTTAMGSLVAKVSRMEAGPSGELSGFCMMIHAFATEPIMGRTAVPDEAAVEGARDEVRVDALPVTGAAAMEALCPLMKLPLIRGNGGVISLVDVADVVCLVAQGHYAEVKTVGFSAFCPRSMADLERRLDPAQFLRVHRRYLVNLRHVQGAERVDGGWYLLLADKAGTRVPVSRAKVDTIRRLLAV